MTPELTKREYFAALAMQTIINFKKPDTYSFANNVEDCCGEVAAASCRMADALILHLDNPDMQPRSPAYGNKGTIIKRV
jgi:hypothetical protein